MSWYLTIRADSRFSRSAATATLVKYLRTLPELAEVAPMDFRNAPGSPWLCVVLAMANERGGYAITGEILPAINVVELICGDGNENWYDSLAYRIAAFLDWEAIEESCERIIRPAH